MNQTVVLPLTQGVSTGSAVGLQCVTGRVNLFQFIQAPPPGSIIGQIQPFSGNAIFLTQSQPTPLGGISLSSVDGQIANVCGVFTNRAGTIVLDVRVVNPGAPSPTGTPVPFNQQLLLLLLLLLLSGRGGATVSGIPLQSLLSILLSSGGLGSTLGLGGLGLSNLGLSNLGVNTLAGNLNLGSLAPLLNAGSLGQTLNFGSLLGMANPGFTAQNILSQAQAAAQSLQQQ